MPPGAPDARLSNYRLDRLLGSGGMGAVYLARDLALDRDVAIKFLSDEKIGDASARHRLLREAKAAAALDHPNICGVHEVIVEADGRAAIVMQYVEGETLAALLQRGPLEPKHAATIAIDLTEALIAAHKRGIIHRDIKPQNIIITPTRHAKLLDFGVARYEAALSAAQPSQTTTLVTTPGVIIGTPAYMSPEQAQQQELDGRSDLFSLGAVLFECLTGRRAFGGRSAIDILGAVLHEEPPPVSSLRSGLSADHDTLVRQLLAKDPNDRYASAEELLGALRLLSGTTRTKEDNRHQETVTRRRPLLIGGAIAAVLIAAVALFMWTWRPASAAPNPQAAGWYRTGTELIRNGAPHSARRALQEAITVAPNWPAPYIRLAEANTELDDREGAQAALLTVGKLVPSERLLASADRRRVDAVRAVMLRDPDRAIGAYSALARDDARDAGAWLDLGRAQETFGLSVDAQQSYERAVQADTQYAAGYLRRGTLRGREGRREDALKDFAEAHRLFRAGSNIEGEVETLLRRAAMYFAAGDLAAARRDTGEARDLSERVTSRGQQIRAQLTLSSITAAEGRWADAQKMADAAADLALKEDLEGVGAEALVESAIVLHQRGKDEEADAQLVRAIQLATKSNAERMVARATLQRAAIVAESKPEAAIELARGPLQYFQANRYRSYELSALSVMTRAHQQLHQYAEARGLTEQALRTATAIKDEFHHGQTLENLGHQANALGALPEALEHRGRSIDVNRRSDPSALPYDLVNRADLFIRVGRHAEGAALLEEIDAGVAKGIDAFLSRVRRARLMRAVSAAIQHNPQAVARYARDYPPGTDGKPDSSSLFAELLIDYSNAAAGRGAPGPVTRPLAGTVSSIAGREMRYWDLAARLARRDAGSALAGAEETLKDSNAAISYEFEWRIAAIGTAAARQVGDRVREQTLRERALKALARLRQEWKSDVASYEARPDLVELRRKAGL